LIWGRGTEEGLGKERREMAKERKERGKGRSTFEQKFWLLQWVAQLHPT